MPQQVVRSVGLLSKPSKIDPKKTKNPLIWISVAKDGATPKRQLGTAHPF
jgi:hypothetical protein